jgi:UDP-N-acetyl-2-amino-2-deoxyglucuronate dehydrogenase
MSEGKEFGVILVGAGFAGRMHAKAFSAIPDAVVRAVVDIDVDAARSTAEECGLSREVGCYGSLSDALRRSDVDVVDICAPPEPHCDLTLQAVAAGKHALVEKPMAQTLDECDRMIDGARANSVVLGQVFQNRFNRTPLRIKALLADGALGPITRVCVYGSTIHAYDTLVWLFGDPLHVYAEWPRQIPEFAEHPDWDMLQFEHRWSALARFPNGVVGSLLSGQRDNSLPQIFPFQDDSVVIDIVGERAAVSFTIWGQSVQFRTGPDRNKMIDRSYLAEVQHRFEIMYPEIGLSVPVGHKAVLKDFFDGIRSGQSPSVTGNEGRRTVELMTAVYSSASSGNIVRLPLRPEHSGYRTAILPVLD